MDDRSLLMPTHADDESSTVINFGMLVTHLAGPLLFCNLQLEEFLDIYYIRYLINCVCEAAKYLPLNTSSLLTISAHLNGATAHVVLSELKKDLTNIEQ